MRKVLIINSNHSSTEKIASVLTESGFEVTNVATEWEGLKLIDEFSPDAIIVKDDPTQIDGSNLCQQIRQLFVLPLILLGDRPEEEIYPQTLINVEVTEKPEISEVPQLREAIKQVEAELGDQGRVLVRYSGTENLCRVMVEGPSEESTQAYCKQIAVEVERALG